MVTPSSFGVVKLLNLDFDGQNIILELQDCTAGTVKEVPTDINCKTNKFVLIFWDDIKDLVMEDILTNSDDDMLKFEI